MFRLSYKRKSDSILIQVIDKGCGIPSESLPLVFDRFYRADESRNKATGGFGLGLAIAKEIVSNHKGTISVFSKISEGTKIEIILPQ
ncbi:MAG: sensor histidine kinase [Bacteroidota bacterium]|nr:sensor histidine kinase [Bacteroidota bacterium]